MGNRENQGRKNKAYNKFFTIALFSGKEFQAGPQRRLFQNFSSKITFNSNLKPMKLLNFLAQHTSSSTDSIQHADSSALSMCGKLSKGSSQHRFSLVRSSHYLGGAPMMPLKCLTRNLLCTHRRPASCRRKRSAPNFVSPPISPPPPPSEHSTMDSRDDSRSILVVNSSET